MIELAAIEQKPSVETFSNNRNTKIYQNFYGRLESFWIKCMPKKQLIVKWLSKKTYKVVTKRTNVEQTSVQ